MTLTTRLFPYAPNWMTPVAVTLEFRTDVATARSSREQRRALRSVPRRRLEFSVLQSGPSLGRLLAVWQNRWFSMGDPTRLTTLTATAAATATTINVASLPGWLVAGATVTLDGTETGSILSIAGSTVTLTAPLAAQHVAGAEVRPALTGLIGSEIGGRHHTNRLTETPITFAVMPGSEAFDAGAAGMDTHDGREVLLRRLNWMDGIEASFNWDAETIDFGHGVIDVSWPTVAPTKVQTGTALLNGPAEIDELGQFFVRQHGRLGEFLVPQWLDDIPMEATITAGQAWMNVAGLELFLLYRDHPVYRAVAFLMRDGRALFRSVTLTHLPSSVTRLTFDRAFYFDVTPADVAMVTWLPVARFASDSMTFEFTTAEVAQVSLSVQTLPYEAAEGAVTVYDGAADWTREAWGGGVIGAFDRLDWIVNVRYPGIVI